MATKDEKETATLTMERGKTLQAQRKCGVQVTEVGELGLSTSSQKVTSIKRGNQVKAGLRCIGMQVEVRLHGDCIPDIGLNCKCLGLSDFNK